MKRSIIYLFCLVLPIFAQKKTTIKTIANHVKGMQKFVGKFTYYYDKKTDKIWLQIDAFDQEFLYVNSLPAGIGSNDIGLDRPRPANGRVGV